MALDLGGRSRDAGAVESQRATGRIVAGVEQEKHAAYASEYVVKVEGEFRKISGTILAQMDKNLISLACVGESKLFCYKMKCDYYRYLAEISTSDAKCKATEDARVAFAEATKITGKD